MLLLIRISGQVDLTKEVKETLYRIRLRKKYSAVLIKPTQHNLKILKKIRNYIAYGTINLETLNSLIQKRAILKNSLKSKRIDAEKIIEQIEKKDSKSWDIKPFFRLHPPRGGIDSKKHFGTSQKAVLGDNKEKINDLVRRML